MAESASQEWRRRIELGQGLVRASKENKFSGKYSDDKVEKVKHRLAVYAVSMLAD